MLFHDLRRRLHTVWYRDPDRTSFARYQTLRDSCNIFHFSFATKLAAPSNYHSASRRVILPWPRIIVSSFAADMVYTSSRHQLYCANNRRSALPPPRILYSQRCPPYLPYTLTPSLLREPLDIASYHFHRRIYTPYRLTKRHSSAFSSPYLASSKSGSPYLPVPPCRDGILCSASAIHVPSRLVDSHLHR